MTGLFFLRGVHSDREAYKFESYINYGFLPDKLRSCPGAVWCVPEGAVKIADIFGPQSLAISI